MPRTVSLSFKLTFLMVAVLGVVLVATLATAYRAVARAERAAATEALRRAARELAGSAETSTQQRARSLRDLGADSTIRELFLGDVRDSAMVRGVLRRRLSTIDSVGPIRLWTPDGRLRTTLALDVSENAPEAREFLPRRDDSTRYGPFFAAHGGVFYWTVSPVLDRGRLIGWIGERRQLASSPQDERRVQGLVGSEVSLLFRNDTGRSWFTLRGTSVEAPAGEIHADGLVHYRRGSSAGELLAAEGPIRGTPWTLVLERPVRATTAVARSTFMQLGAFGLILLLMASGAAWLLSRRFTRPIVDVADAAQSMAQGNYERRISAPYARRNDEVGQLAASFNHMAEEVLAAHSELEHQVEEAQSLNEELEQAVREADEANRAKSAFVARMSHELRTPLNAIAGYTELLEMGVRGPVNAEQLEDLRRIKRSQRALLSLIDDVLSVSRIESGHLEYRIGPVVVRDVVAEVESLLAAQARAKEQHLDVASCPTYVALGDPDRVRQILTNLVTNAIKFTDRHGAIEIACHRDDGHIAVKVSDSGIGIAPERLDVIFEPFVQLRDGLTRTAEGMGLGLAIARELARAMRGDVTVVSRDGEGSVFTLTLPAAPERDSG